MKIAIYGCGGFGREVAPLIREQCGAVLFVSDNPGEHGPDCVPLDQLPSGYQIVIAIASADARRRLAVNCEAAGRTFASVNAITARRLGDVSVGEGAILCDSTILTDNARIGRHFQANFLSYVGHDCVIGDFVTLAPRTGISGNTIVEDDVYIGTGAILRHGTPERPLRIGRGAVIGMGAVVTRDVPPGATVFGNPARTGLGRESPSGAPIGSASGGMP